MSVYVLKLVSNKIDTTEISFVLHTVTCAIELLVNIFHSIEAGISNAISSFKGMKNNIISEKKTSPKLNYLINRLTERLPRYMLQI